MQIAGISAAESPCCSQAVSEHASRPTRSIVIPDALKNATSVSGSLADPSFTHNPTHLIDHADGGIFQ